MCRRTTRRRSIPPAGCTRSASGRLRSETRARQGRAPSPITAAPGSRCSPATSSRSGWSTSFPLLDPVKVTHSKDPGGANLPMNLTNLHTHGLIVPARAPTLSDPTFGDYVFVEIYNPANGIPVPQTTHQHGSIVQGYADYRIDIPANHPDGAFWFHPHVHGLALNQVSEGLAGIISIGSVGAIRAWRRDERAVSRCQCPPSRPQGHAGAGGRQHHVRQRAGERRQRRGARPGGPGFLQPVSGARRPRCARAPVRAADNSAGGGVDYTGGSWFFTVSGQQYPTITLNEPDGEMWRSHKCIGEPFLRSSTDEQRHRGADGDAARLGRRGEHQRSSGYVARTGGADRRSAVLGRSMPRGDRDRHAQLGARLHQRARHDAELARGGVGQLSGRATIAWRSRRSAPPAS